MGTLSERSQELEAFLDALHNTAPEVVTACDGWTVHEIVAHLAGGAAEITRHLEAYLRGEPIPDTQSFEVREAPFRAMDDSALRKRLEVEEDKLRSVIDEVLTQEPDAVIPWTGRQMPVAKFVPHMRSEFAVHRWDFAGDDDITRHLLAQPALTEHAVSVLGPMLVLRGSQQDPAAGEDFHVRLRADGARDVRVVVQSGQAALQLADDDTDEPYAEVDAAARTLIIWGRRPDQRGRFRSHMAQPLLARLQALLSGY
ncbi:maleylpyruvate isomerase N-terminal domain-containing protein [Mycobacterium sp. THU-M104]|uniref:maleylpyruvate isomerase N-terminal domain-containing protein n=1 Tax=Mycobacterium sp. THU-M104 TaxID=3410515 RepID=UPI003B9CCE56